MSTLSAVSMCHRSVILLSESMQKAIKRIFDVLFSLIVIVALAPVWIVVSLWIACTSKGGVFFPSEAHGA